MIAYSTVNDVQNQNDDRGLSLDFVGVSRIALPISIVDKKKNQHTTAKINFYAELNQTNRGQHLSRFIEILYKNSKENISLKTLRSILNEAKIKFNVKKTYIEVFFPYFLIKKSPVTKKNSVMDYDCKLSVESNGNIYEQKLTVNVPVLLLCPCSKAISKYNAHNQKALVKVEISFTSDVWIESLITAIEREGSHEIFALLKRPDEKHVTEKSYENPKFVEDVVRDVALKLKRIKTIKSFVIECESFESIHNHNAYAKYISSKDLE